MTWNMAPEGISIVVLCIIWIYSRRGNLIPSLKNRLFQASFLMTFCAMASNLLSAVLLDLLNPYNITAAWGVTLVYYIATPLMGVAYFFYTLASIYEGQSHIKKYFIVTSVPGLLYIVMVLMNPFTHSLFDISLEGGYTRGPAISATYIVFYFYCVLCMLFVLFGAKGVSRSTRIILFSFPLIAGLVIGFQMLFPTVVLTGSAATCSLMLIYLYLQNKQISIDHLTRVPNRGEFLKMLELKIKKEIPFEVTVLSLKDFKAVNGRYGQHNGDDLLAAVGAFLRKDLSLREGEVYRYGGDEFALLLENPNPKRTEEMIGLISARMTKPWETKGCTCMLGGSIGIVRYPDTSDQTEGLINGLEYAVNIAKKDEAGGFVCYCSPELLVKAKRRQQIAGLLKQSLEEDRFTVVYQPILSVDTGCFVMAEALLRMNGTPLGNLSPGEFIPIAEESGLIIEITYRVLDKVCRDIRRLLDDGVNLDGISVNFSALQFGQKDLIERMTEIFARHDVPFSKVKVEITESVLAENKEAIYSYIHQMHGLGIRIGLDDFGTGYSNLSSVIELPLDTIKLDKSLVWSSMQSGPFSIVVQNLTRAFRELGLRVLAEGVENEEQSQFVTECGCSLIQGFLYARPVPYGDFAEFMKEKQPS